MRKVLSIIAVSLCLLAPASAQLTMMGVGGAVQGSGVTTVTWNGSDQIGITLSNGNLTATYNDTGSRGGIRATTSFSTGKLYYELQLNFSASSNMGGTWASGTKNFATTFLGGDTLSTGAYRDNSIYFNSGSLGSYITTVATGDWIGIALDLTNNKIWIMDITQGGGWNNAPIGSQNPATNTGGGSLTGLTGLPWFPAAAFDAVATGTYSVTANFGGSAFLGSVPSGFVAVQH